MLDKCRLRRAPSGGSVVVGTRRLPDTSLLLLLAMYCAATLSNYWPLASITEYDTSNQRQDILMHQFWEAAASTGMAHEPQCSFHFHRIYSQVTRVPDSGRANTSKEIVI